MTKIQKIQEIIREYESGVDADITVEEVLNGIKNTIEDDDRYYDREIASTTPTPADEIDFDKELIFDSLSLESEYFGYSAEPHFESENSISWALTVNSNLERIFIERGGYNKEQLAASVGDEYIEGLNPLDYDDIYAEHYLVVDKDKNITIENQVKRSGEDVTTCGVTVLSPSESKAFCAYINKYLAMFNGRSIDSYFAENDNLVKIVTTDGYDECQIRNGELIKYTGCKTVVDVPEGVTKIGTSVFSRRPHLKTVTLPDGLTDIKMAAFEGCGSLQSVTLPDTVQSIEASAFSGCRNLKSVSIPAGCDCDAKAFDKSCKVTQRNSTPKQSNKQTRSMKI